MSHIFRTLLHDSIVVIESSTTNVFLLQSQTICLQLLEPISTYPTALHAFGVGVVKFGAGKGTKKWFVKYSSKLLAGVGEAYILR
jgi:hypothetical protein